MLLEIVILTTHEANRDFKEQYDKTHAKSESQKYFSNSIYWFKPPYNITLLRELSLLKRKCDNSLFSAFYLHFQFLFQKKIYMLTFSRQSKKKLKFHSATHYSRANEAVRKLKIIMNNNNNKNVDKLFLKGPDSCTNMDQPYIVVYWSACGEQVEETTHPIFQGVRRFPQHPHTPRTKQYENTTQIIDWNCIRTNGSECHSIRSEFYELCSFALNNSLGRQRSIPGLKMDVCIGTSGLVANQPEPGYVWKTLVGWGCGGGGGAACHNWLELGITVVALGRPQWANPPFMFNDVGPA